MIRTVLYILAASAIAPFLHAEEQARLDSSETLFTVMAAANAAGYKEGISSSPEMRKRVNQEVAAANAPVVKELHEWYLEHTDRDPVSDLTRFISLGLYLKGAPDFAWSASTNEVPPDAMSMDGFRALLPRFFSQANIEKVWQESQPAIEAELNRYQEPTAKTLLEVNAYLRNPTYGFLGRHFVLYLEPLAAPNQVQTRSYKDDYFVVITPSSEVKTAAIRHAYLRYLLDPLAIKYGEEINEKESLLDVADRAPLLREPYRTDFDLFASECLIRAIESRMTSNPGMVDAAVKEGLVLTPFFSEQLAIYEKEPESMRLFFPKMIAALDVKKEKRRVEGVEFAKTAPGEAPRKIDEPKQARSAAGKVLEQGDAAYSKRDLEHAEAAYRKALELPGAPAEHAAAYFGLAHVALMKKDPDQAEEMLKKTLESSPSPDVEAWSCYYLGMLAIDAQDRDGARVWFERAAQIAGAPEKVVKLSREQISAKPAGSSQ